MNRKQNFKLMLLAGVAVNMLVLPAQAEEGADKEAAIESITVVAKRQQYRGDVPVRDMPQNIQVLDKKFLTDAGITGLAGALDLSGSVARQNNFGGLWDAFAVRGFSGDENVPSGYLVNGFNGGRGFGGPRDASNIERIEILKGPNAALFGRGEPGGTVNIITKKPQFEAEGMVAASIGRWNSHRFEGDYTRGLTDKLAFRVNGAYEESDGFRDYTSSKSYTISPSLLYQFSDATSLTYEGEFVHKEIPFDRGTIAINGELGLVPRSRFLGEPGDGPMRVNVSGHQLEFKQAFGDDWGLLVGLSHRNTHMVGYSSDTELSGGRQPFYQDGETLTRQRRFRDFSTKHTVVRAELSGSLETGGITQHIMFGGDVESLGLNQRQDRWRNPFGVAFQDLPLNQIYAINIYDPVYGAAEVTVAPLVHHDEKQKSFGIYLHDQIDLTDKLKLRFGGRYDHFKQTIYNVLTSADLTPQSLNSLSLQGGVVYDISENVAFYAAYGEGFRPNSGTDFAGNTFDPEATVSYETGMKFQTEDSSMNGTLALFYMEKTNILTSDPVNSGFTMAAGDARSRGIELDVSGRLFEGLNYMVSYAYTDAEYTTSAADKDFGYSIAKGDPLINVPKHSGSVTLSYDTTIKDMPFNVGSSLQFVGKRLGQTGTDYTLPSYELVKIFASIEPVKNLRVSLTIDNLFDKNYWPQSYGDLWTTQGEPRKWTVRAAYSF